MNAQTKVKAETLIDALAVALPQLEAAKKGNVNPHFKSKYADLGSVIDAIRPVAEHGIWFTQVSHENERGAMIETFFIGHGEKISAGTLFVPADKTNAQGFGSALTYARRYGLQTAFGLSTEDDDGNAASAAPRAAERQSEGSAVSSRQPINDSEWTLLVQLVETTNTNTQALCEAYKVASLKDLNADQYADAKRILEARLKKQAEATREPA